MTSPVFFTRKLLAATAGGALAGLLAATPATAIEFDKGELSGSLDTTISYGASIRVEDRDEDLIGKANLNAFVGQLPLDQQIAAPGRFSVNSDDGNLNYDDGDLISHAIKITSELGLNWRNYGAFFRATGFYDFENEDKDELSNIAQNEFVGSDATLLDAFIYGDFDIGDRFLTARLGRQVVSWGENTFIQGGINVINPVDLSKLRVAGAELKEAFLPIDQIWTSFQVTENTSLEALYMFEFEQIDPDPAGTYFSTNDFATPGGQYVMLGFGLAPQPVINPDNFYPVCFGGQPTDINFAGAPPEAAPALTATGCASAVPRSPDRFPDESGQYGAALRYYAGWLGAGTEFGLYYLNYHSRLPLISGTSVTNSNVGSGRYFVEYPEDIELFGLSFNTTLGRYALAGEIAYRDNLPLQIDDVEVLFTALSPLNALIPEPANRFNSQLGDVPPGTDIQGWERHEVTQISVTLSRVFGPSNPFRANQWVVLGELGATKVWDLPSPDVLRYQAPGTDTGGGPDAFSGGALRNPVTTPTGQFADDFSWGYRLLTRLDYNNAFGTPINLFPIVAFNHDVSGNAPGPGGNFIEDRKSLTLTLRGTYLEQWGAEISYTSFFGGGDQNLISDRDFVSASINYSF